MKSYKQLTQEQRYHIYALRKTNHTQEEISNELGVNQTTISRELSRNTGERGYRPLQAHSKSTERKQNASKHIKLTTEIKKVIDGYLCLDWSPEQITGYLKSNKKEWVSHERIYQYILEDKNNGGGDLWKHLRQSNKKRKKRYGSTDRRGQIKDRISIDERPKHIEKRERIGDWEIDLIIGKNQQHALLTIVDRLSLKTFIGKIEDKRAETIYSKMVELLAPHKKYVFTITADNGKEFAAHKKIAKALATDFYFAHPYSSWERGTNENTNGLIRQYAPKGSSFLDIDDSDTAFMEDRINNRPRKCLGWHTANEMFANLH